MPYSSLPPFAMYAAFPRSHYYGGSVLHPRPRRTYRLARLRVSGARIGVPVFEEETLGAVGGRLYPWQRGPRAESGRGSGEPMTGAPSLAEIATRLWLHSRAVRELFAPYRGLKHRLQPAGVTRLLRHGTCGSPSREQRSFLGQFRPLGCCRSPHQITVTFAVPFCIRPDSDEDDIFRSSVSPSPHGAHSAAREGASVRRAWAGAWRRAPRTSSTTSYPEACRCDSGY